MSPTRLGLGSAAAVWAAAVAFSHCPATALGRAASAGTTPGLTSGGPRAATRAAAPAGAPAPGAGAVAARSPGPWAAPDAAPGASPGAGPWARGVVSASATSPMSVAAADVDGDGDTDVLSVSLFGDLTWHDNTLGDASSWSDRRIATPYFPFWVDAADLDGDGDTDAVVGATDCDLVTWHENLSGDGSAWMRHSIVTGCFTARAVVAADVDGDGDSDVAMAAENGDRVSWHENLAGDGSTWVEHVVDRPPSPLALSARDMDADGDVDLVAAVFGTGSVWWYQNAAGDGSSWVPVLVSANVGGAHGVAAADVDRDGDIDALSAAFLDDRLAWHERLDAAGLAWSLHPLPATGGDYTTVSAVDLDRDGDVDALSAAFDVGDCPPFEPVLWLENASGDGSTWLQHVLPVPPGKIRQALAADLDGDCDLDVVYASSLDDTVGWLENLAVPVDCNANGIGDACDIAAGTSLDEDGDGVPDECPLPWKAPVAR